MRDEKEERKKQARSNKQTRQSNTAHPRQSLFLEKYMYTDMYIHVHVANNVYTFRLGRYGNLVSGDYKSHVDEFLSTPHSLTEFSVEIEKLRSISSEISGLDDVAFFDMVRLECSDIKTSLLTSASELLTQLVQQLARDHVEDSMR